MVVSPGARKVQREGDDKGQGVLSLLPQAGRLCPHRPSAWREITPARAGRALALRPRTQRALRLERVGGTGRVGMHGKEGNRPQRRQKEGKNNPHVWGEGRREPRCGRESPGRGRGSAGLPTPLRTAGPGRLPSHVWAHAWSGGSIAGVVLGGDSACLDLCLNLNPMASLPPRHSSSSSSPPPCPLLLLPLPLPPRPRAGRAVPGAGAGRPLAPAPRCGCRWDARGGSRARRERAPRTGRSSGGHGGKAAVAGGPRAAARAERGARGSPLRGRGRCPPPAGAGARPGLTWGAAGGRRGLSGVQALWRRT